VSRTRPGHADRATQPRFSNVRRKAAPSAGGARPQALTLLSLAPAMVIALTSFTRAIIVLSMLRHALCMQETPPNTVLVTLALFVTLFSSR
jgi:flagellar biosynthesis protein FliP